MRDVYLVTMFVEKLSFPIGYFPLEEALRMRRELLESYRESGYRTDILITGFDKLPSEGIAEEQAAVRAAN